MAISERYPNAYVDLAASQSITVAPLSGQAHINPGEQFNITLTGEEFGGRIRLRVSRSTMSAIM